MTLLYASGAVLARTEQVRDVGVIYDCKFTFISHINKVVSKANNKLSCMMRNTKDFKKPDSYINLYLSLVRTTLIYASPVWNPHQKLYS